MIRLKSLLKEQDPKDIQSAVTFAQDVVKWLDKCSNSTPDARKWKLVNGFVNVEGDFDFEDMRLTDLKGVRFGVVVGNFNCLGNYLTSLVGAPKEVGGYFVCNRNQLTSLKGAPQRVGGGFYCAVNLLTSLEGAPQRVGGDFDCSDNQLTTLEGAPQRVGWMFRCSRNQLTSLKGAPQQVGASFNCSDNNLTSLEGAPQKVGGSFYYPKALGTPDKVKPQLDQLGTKVLGEVEAA